MRYNSAMRRSTGQAWCHGHCQGSVLLRCPTGQGDDLMAVVEDEVPLEAEEPAHRGLAALGQTGEDLVPVNALGVADRQGSGGDVIEPGPGPQVADETEHQRHEDTFLQGD